MRTSFDKIATDCRKVSKCLRCWDYDDGMYIEIEIDNPMTKFSTNYLLSKANEIVNKYNDIIATKPYFSSGSDYDSYIIKLKKNKGVIIYGSTSSKKIIRTNKTKFRKRVWSNYS